MASGRAVIVLIGAVGRLSRGPERDLVDRYVDRTGAAGNRVGVRAVREIEVAEGRARDLPSRLGAEGRAILAAIPHGSAVIALDEAGALWDSAAFADRIAAHAGRGAGTLAFLIGGPDGHAPTVRDRAEAVVALGRHTMPHGLVRVVLAEQIYRAVTILAGHPYHRGAPSG